MAARSATYVSSPVSWAATASLPKPSSSASEALMNVLRMLGMAEGEIERPARQLYCPNMHLSLRPGTAASCSSTYSVDGASGQSVRRW